MRLLERGQPETAILERVANAQIASELADHAADDADLLHGHENLAPGPGDGLVATDIGRDRERRIVAELVEQEVQAIPQAVLGAGMRDRKSPRLKYSH